MMDQASEDATTYHQAHQYSSQHGRQHQQDSAPTRRHHVEQKQQEKSRQAKPLASGAVGANTISKQAGNGRNASPKRPLAGRARIWMC